MQKPGGKQGAFREHNKKTIIKSTNEFLLQIILLPLTHS